MTDDVMKISEFPNVGQTTDMDMDFTQTFKMKRDGKRPLMFDGTELCSAMSYAPGTPLWYEINIVQKLDESFVVEVRMFTKGENERDRFNAYEFSDIESVFEFLENYDTSHDIDCGIFKLSEAGVSAAELGLRSASLRLRMDEARYQFNDLVGQILYELESV